MHILIALILFAAPFACLAQSYFIFETTVLDVKITRPDGSPPLNAKAQLFRSSGGVLSPLVDPVPFLEGPTELHRYYFGASNPRVIVAAYEGEPVDFVFRAWEGPRFEGASYYLERSFRTISRDNDTEPPYFMFPYPSGSVLVMVPEPNMTCIWLVIVGVSLCVARRRR